MKSRRRLIQYGIIILLNAIILIFSAIYTDGLEIQSLVAAIGVAVAFVTSQVLFWWLFINFFSFLPVLLYPSLTLILAGGTFWFMGNLVPGVLIADFRMSAWVTGILTLTNAVLGSLFSLDVESKFDRYVTHKLVERHGNPIKTKEPGFLFFEIDGLSEKLFRRALDENYMPTLQRWRDEGMYKILGWETDFSAQTAAMQAGILMGNNDNVPAYRWWDRNQNKIIESGFPWHAAEIEDQVSSGQGLLANGGVSRCNMFSGDAEESIFTFSTALDRNRGRGPGFYLYLINPFIVAHLAVRFITEVIKEWWQALWQKLRKDKYIVSARNFSYAFFRAAVGPLLQGLTTFVVISDIQRGLPAIYAMYAAYDDIAHFAGMDTPEAMEALSDIDCYIARIERALSFAPRPYHLVILSDHGHSSGPTFQAAYGTSLEQLVKASIEGDPKVFASLNVHEMWDRINAFLSESINANTRTARVLRTMLGSRVNNGMVTFGLERKRKKEKQELVSIAESRVIIIASGCVGMVYFANRDQRMFYEDIQNSFPDLLLNLVAHPGIGYVLVRSIEFGDLVLGRGGINFLDQNIYEGTDPLQDYPVNAAAHLKRESSFSNCPDIVVNTCYDPKTEEISSFENQVGHHGGLGGLQNYPFIFYPVTLPVSSKPIVGATKVFELLQRWRNGSQSSNSKL